MIYLNKAFFKPILILESILFLPLSTVFLIACILNFSIALLIGLGLLVSVYAISTIFLYQYSNSHRYWLTMEDDWLMISYPNIMDNSTELRICKKDIVKIEYYRLFSVRSWLMLHNYVCPQCAFITFVHDDKKYHKLCGYPDYKELKALCEKEGIAIV